jgi:signal transduction histidine kinase
LRRLGQLEQQFDQALEHARLQSLGELAYGASHEINNPLANISTRAQAMLAQESDPEKRRMLSTINSQAFRAHEMIADMMLFARPPALVRQRLDLVALVDEVLAELQEDAHLQGSQIARHGSSDAVLVEADATQLATAIRAVCVNALEALVAQGQVHVAVAQIEPAEQDVQPWARITIHDTGPGIPPQIRPHIFDPFFSGREAGRGLGFGLPKCWRVITLHGGRIDVASLERQGTTFTLDLPLAVAAPHAAESL